MSEKCPVCSASLRSIQRDGANHRFRIECSRCGKFRLSEEALSFLPIKLSGDAKAVALLAHEILKLQKRSEWPLLTTGLIDELLEKPLPSPAEQADNLILWLAEISDYPGDVVLVIAEINAFQIGAINGHGFELIFDHVYSKGFIEGHATRTADRGLTSARIRLTMEGWTCYEKLHRGKASGRKAFMAMQFDNSDLQDIFKTFFKPAVKSTGFDLIRLDEFPKAGLIDNRLVSEIANSHFLVADLTDRNLGAYWEAGFATGLGKPVIYTCESDVFDERQTHFDTNHHHTIKWCREKPHEAAEELKVTIRATLPTEAILED